MKDFVKQLIITEEMDRVADKMLQATKQVKPQTIKEIKTDKVYLENITISSPKNILKLNTKGKLLELLLKSNNYDYSIQITTDIILFKKSWSKISNVSSDLKSITAYESENEYVLTIEDIKFNSIEVNIQPNKEITFGTIYLKYEYEV
jgi:hypothetical protein